MGERTGVWADPKTVDAAQWEFKEDTERFRFSDCDMVKRS
jgi:hypothetical protein